MSNCEGRHDKGSFCVKKAIPSRLIWKSQMYPNPRYTPSYLEQEKISSVEGKT